MTERIAVVGMWHLGCSIAASWLKLGHFVTAIDFNDEVVKKLRSAESPVVEPGVNEEFRDGFAERRFAVYDSPSVSRCKFVFIAYDTPVETDDTSDVCPIWDAIGICGPHLDTNTIVVVSSQLPVGEARKLRSHLKTLCPSAELIYSPENLRLGQAMDCYLNPGHIVIGSESIKAAIATKKLFDPMHAEIFHMNLPSAEMTKHCINSFLATSITLANQWADISMAVGADYGTIERVLRRDPRIGKSAYITPGIGFSGGTLGRDLKVLASASDKEIGGSAPIFDQVWSYNSHRPYEISDSISELIGGTKGNRIALLGMTYKPGTSTLRRSLPLEIAKDLHWNGATVAVHDPLANWEEANLPSDMIVSDSPYAAAEGADIIVLLTEWPMYKDLDFDKLASVMNQPLMFDTKNFLAKAEASGFSRVVLGRGAL